MAAGFSAGGGFVFAGDRPGFCRYSGAMAGQVRGLRHLPGNFADQLVCPGADVVAQLLLVEEVGRMTIPNGAPVPCLAVSPTLPGCGIAMAAARR